MKTIKLISILLLTMSIVVCCDKEAVEPIPVVEPMASGEISLSDSYKNVFLNKRGHWGAGNDRVSTYSGKVYMTGSTLVLHFEGKVADLRLRLKDSDNQLILNEIISGDKNSSYTIPVTFIQDKWYMLEVSRNSDDLYLEFIIE